MGAMELEEKTVQIRDDFDPDKILESGQCFRPRKQAEGWYRFVSGRQLLYLRPLRSGTYTVRCEPGAWETFWHGYFDLGRSYAALRGKLDSRDDFLQRAMEYGRGIRVLRQDEWEMLVSFIISQRKSIPAIRRAVELLSERFGERLGSDSDGSFNVYDDIRTKLLAAGVPESEVEFIHNADTEGKKADLFSKVRSGKVRVLLGSTAKMGAGTNVQTLLVAVHHLDVGWRPSDMTQRNGRIIRQGNKNKQVYVYNYVTEGTFDAYLWQTLENKQKFISQIMTSKSPMRSCDDVDEQALSYAEVKALCAGDPRIREKMDLDVQVAKLKVLRSDYQNQKYRLEDKLLKHYPEEIQKAKNRIAALKNDAQIADAHPQDKENFCGMTIKGMVFDEKKAAGERLMLACKEMPNADMMLLGTYRGFELNIRFDSFKNEHQIVLRGELSYPVPLGDDPRGNIVRLDNAIGNFADRIADAEAALDSLEQQKQAAEVEIAKPFAQEEELQTKSARLAELDALLNMEHQSSRTEPEAEEKPDARPSVLAALEEKADKVEPVRPFKSYLDKDGDAR